MRRIVFTVMSLLMVGSMIFSSFVPTTAQSTRASEIEPSERSGQEIATACPTDLFFSEYIEGGSNNKALEIYNGTGAAVDLSQYRVELYSNGSSSPINPLTPSGTLAPGDVFVIANASAIPEILALADTTSTVTYFNGDDALALLHNDVIIDVIGQIGFDPGTVWGTGDVTTLNHTLVRKSSVMQGDANGSDAFDPAVEWDGYAQDYTGDLGTHTIDPCGSGGSLTIAKSVTPNANVSYHDTVTYTVVLDNSMAVSDTVLFTDTLPTEVDFDAWVEMPTGAAVAADEITWSGTVTASEAITFTFTANHVGNYGDVITNTAEFSGTTQTGTADAAFTVANLSSDITFAYHDLEDVVQSGEAVYLAGDFNSWNPTSTPLTADGAFEVFSTTITGLAAGNYDYKYIVYTDTVPSGPAHWEWLNTSNRTTTVSTNATVDDYRNVTVGWANLQWPGTITGTIGTATSNIYGRLYIQNVTNTPGTEGRGLKAQVGYGTTSVPADWTWFPMSFQGDDGTNNDEFVGTLTPTLPGVFSYATRYDGNWGSGNPNAGWTYASLNGIPFDPDQTGVMTVPLALVPIGTARGYGAGWTGAMQGQVTVAPGMHGSNVFAIQDSTGGIYIYAGSYALPAMALGDTVLVTGTLKLYNGLLEVDPVQGVVNLGAGTVPDPAPTATGSVDPTQGLLIEVTGTATWSSAPPAPGAANWTFYIDDGSGPVAVFVDRDTAIDMTGYTSPAEMTVIGFSGKYNNPQVMPRMQSDIVVAAAPDFTIAKSAPATVGIGESFAYTLVATNDTGAVRNNVVITDSLPLSVTVGTISDGGTATGNVVRWDVTSLADGAAVTRTVQVTAPNAGATLVNSDYGVWASDWITRVVGSAVNTVVEEPAPPILPIYDLQYTTIAGTGGTYPSLYENEVVTTTGTICALLSKGYILTDAPGPWHSLYSYSGSGAKPQLGGEYLLRGTLLEYNGMTEFSYPGRAFQGDGADVCAPTVVTAAEAPYNVPATTEQYESVIVEYHDITITSVTTNRAFFTDSSGGTGAIGKDGYYPTDIQVGQQYIYVRGPLIYTYDEYRVMPPSASDIRLLDLTAPTVLSTLPANGATGVSPYQPLYATFNEPVSPTTVSAATFIVTGPGGAVAGTVTYDAANKQATFTPAAALNASTTYTATLTGEIKDFSDNALVPYTWSFTTGPADVTAPTVIERIPDADATDVALNANIVVTFSESLKPVTVVAGNFTLEGPYGTAPWDSVAYDMATSRLTLNPKGLLLPETVYTFTIAPAVTDWAGLAVADADRSWSFTTQIEPPMTAYLGDLHNHTGYSDGSLTPFDAYTRAKAAGLDYLAITDHSYAVDDVEWADSLAQAEAFTENGVFVGLRGFEYTQGAEGHVNVYNTVRHAVRSDVGGVYADYTPNLEKGETVDGFYNWLAITGTQALDDSGTVMMFNHPGWINFNDWKYHPEVEEIVQLEEVGNGWGSSYFFSWEEWIRSLDYGWKVGATNNSDNHTPNWGTITTHRTGIVAPALTKADLMDALRAGRTYASEDANTTFYFKANGYWMGSELPNTGSMSFEVWGDDPDGELITQLELYTDGGVVAASTQPTSADFNWTFSHAITPGVHYYFVMATQADGDRIVSSPVWTMGEEDISITDLTVQPTIPTIYNPNLFTARITNRGATTQTLTVAFSVNGTPIGTVEVTVPSCQMGPCEDAFANISWQATEIGPAEVVAQLIGAPSSDNPEDNTATLDLIATDEPVPLIVIDYGHNNIASDPSGVRPFVNDMTAHGYNILFNLDEITATDLNTATTKLLIINAFGPAPLTGDELTAIADYVAAGGSVWLNGLSDYTGKVEWADTVADRLNDIAVAVEARTGQEIPIRMNDDEVLDGNNNNGYQWGVIWHLFPSAFETGIGMNVDGIQTWSVSSLVDRNKQGLSQADLGEDGFIIAMGDLDTGSSSGAHYVNVPNRTHNLDADSWGDAYVYPVGEALPGAAGYDIPGDAGRFFFYGDSNDPFNIFSYTAGDGRQNELFNIQAVMWLLGEPLQKQTIAEVREGDDEPVALRKLVWIEGVVTAAYGEFFDVLYVQDDTGGITIFAPAGTASAAVGVMPERGDFVRVLGTVDIYQGDTELQFFETEQVQIITPTHIISTELALGGNFLRPLSTAEAASEENEGWLMVVTGTVTSKAADNSYIIMDDGSGPVRAFLDGYNGTWETIHVLDRVTVAGLGSEDFDGQRIRVRHFQNDSRPDDAALLPGFVDLSQSFKAVNTVEVYPGALLTYTLNFVNSGNLTATVEYTDTLPAALTLVSGSLEDTVEVGPLETLQVIIVAQVQPSTVPGATLVNTVGVNDGTVILNLTSPETTVIAAPELVITKTVEATAQVDLGEIVTYTITLNNEGGDTALGILLTDTLPTGITFGGWAMGTNVTPDYADGVITWTGDLPAGVQPLTIVFTATVNNDSMLYGNSIVNTAEFTSDNAGEGEDDATFGMIGAPVLALVKTVETSAEVNLGDVVTYTLTLSNSGEATAVGVSITDTLPAGVTFEAFVAADGATQANGVITWEGDLIAGEDIVIIFTVAVDEDDDLYGMEITNTASFTSANDGSGSDGASFTVKPDYRIYLPIVAKGFTG